jgi:hypothetical protein
MKQREAGVAAMISVLLADDNLIVRRGRACPHRAVRRPVRGRGRGRLRQRAHRRRGRPAADLLKDRVAEGNQLADAIRAVAAAAAMHQQQEAINACWAGDGLPAFGLGLGLPTGEAAAALPGSQLVKGRTTPAAVYKIAARTAAVAPAGGDRRP